MNDEKKLIITLPSASTCAGKEYYIKNMSSNLNTATIDPNAGETINEYLNEIRKPSTTPNKKTKT